MKRILATGTIAALMVGGAAMAQTPVVYTWTGVGVNVQGIFQQEGRDQRHFETTLGKDGKIKTAAIVGGGNMMDVIGEINDTGGKIKLDGYCKFEAPLTKKQSAQTGGRLH